MALVTAKLTSDRALEVVPFPPHPTFRYPASAPVAIDLFAGAGGLSYGLGMVGIRTAAANEVHAHAGLTYRHNHPGTELIVGDARQLSGSELLTAASRALGRDVALGTVDCVVGGPPCQGFSLAGTKNRSDSRNDLPHHFIRLVLEMRPRVFLFENVYGLVSLYKGAVFEEILTAFRSMPGYAISYEILDATNYGVPSLRKRVIVVGTSLGRPFDFPEQTHRLPRTAFQPARLFGSEGLFLTPTIGEAISDLDTLTEPGEVETEYKLPARSAYQFWARAVARVINNHESTKHSARVMNAFSFIPPGGGANDIPPEIRSKKDGLKRLHPEEVCRAILSAPEDLIHYSRDRIPTVREQARLMSFPDQFVFCGQRTSGNQMRKHGYCSQTQQVGNAVPPFLGAALGVALRNHLMS